MAGLGSFARGAGSYQLSKAQADAINVDTMVKWNKALRRGNSPCDKRSSKRLTGEKYPAKLGWNSWN